MVIASENESAGHAIDAHEALRTGMAMRRSHVILPVVKVWTLCLLVGCGQEAPLVSTVTTVDNLPMAIAVDESTIYWVDWGGNVRSVSKVGGNVQTLFPSPGASVGTSLKIDDSTVYATVTPDTNVGDGFLVRVPKGGGSAVPLSTPDPLYLTLSSDTVFWTWGAYAQSGISSMPKAGGSVSQLLTASPLSPTSELTAINGTLYFADANGAILSVPEAGGPVVPVSSADTDAFNLTTDSTYAYWSESGTTISIYRADVLDGTKIQLTTTRYPVTTIVSDGNWVYYSTADCYQDTNYCVGEVDRVPVAGGSSTTLVGEPAWALALDATTLYWATGYFNSPSMIRRRAL